jgi:hypothetical protein
MSENRMGISEQHHGVQGLDAGPLEREGWSLCEWESRALKDRCDEQKE